MPLQPFGQIRISDIEGELGLGVGSLLNLNDSRARALAGKPSGTIKMSDFYGKSAVVVSPTYALSAASSVNEGSTLYVTVTTTNVANGTVLAWDIKVPTNIHTTITTTQTSYQQVQHTFSVVVPGSATAPDFNVPLSGTCVINNNTATIPLPIKADNLPEGTETFSVNLYKDTSTILTNRAAVIGPINVNDTSTGAGATYAVAVPATIDEGTTGYCTVTTTNVGDGVVLYYFIINTTGTPYNYYNALSAADFVNSKISGSFTINNGTGSLFIEILADHITEGDEAFRVAICTDPNLGYNSVTNGNYTDIYSTFGPLKSSKCFSTIVHVNDTSVNTTPTYIISAPSSANEGTLFAVSVGTTYVPNGTTLGWSVRTSGSGVGYADVFDFSSNINYGTCVINNNAGTFPVSIKEDRLTEGAEIFYIVLSTDTTVGQNSPIIASSSVITINDTSLSAVTYAVSAPSSANEGTTFNATVTTTGVSNATLMYWTYIATGTGAGYATSADFTVYDSGSFYVNNNTATFPVSIKADSLTEGNETFILSISLDAVNSVAVSNTITIIDTSTAAPPTYLLVPITSSGNYTIPAGYTKAELYVVAGGGGGGTTIGYADGGGGGGAGGVIHTSLTVKQGDVITSAIGVGGLGGRVGSNSILGNGTNGGDTSVTYNGINFVTALGGGYGGGTWFYTAPIITPPPTTGSISSCFPAGALVMMADMTQLPIETVKVGDMVMGTNGPVVVVKIDTPILGNRKMISFTDGHQWSEEHAHWARSVTGSQWWWSYNSDTWKAEVEAGFIGGLKDNNSIRTGEGYQYAHIDGWKTQVTTESIEAFDTKLYLPYTNGSPIIVDGYVVGAGVNEANYDYDTIDWNIEMLRFKQS